MQAGAAEATLHDRESRADFDHSVQRYARIAGVVILISFVGGLFGEAYVPSIMNAPTGGFAAAQNASSHAALMRNDAQVR